MRIICNITLILLLAPAFLVLGTPWTPVKADMDRPVLNHQLVVTLEPAAQNLRAADRVQVSASVGSRIEFRLAAHLAIEHVFVDGAEGEYTFHGGRLRITVPHGNSSPELLIEYGGRFADPIPADPLNTDNPGFGVTGTIQPRGVMLLAGAHWYPQALEGTESFDLTVNAPEGMVAVTSGNPLGHATHNGRTSSRWIVGKTFGAFSLVAGSYVVATRKIGTVTAATYFTAPLQHLSNDYLEATGRYLQLYQSLFGPYAFDQFAVVENFFPTGYGFPSFTLLGRQVLQLPFIIHTSLGHEVAHCWWGNGVRVDPSQGNWSEGLTTYVADYLYKERQGKGQDQRLQWLRDFAELVNSDSDFPLSRFSSRTDPATRTVGYDKGAMVFHMLRQTVGDADFWQSLRDIYARHLFDAITWSDFQAAFEHRSGLSLTHFFQQWVFHAGAPQLSLDRVAVSTADKGFVVNGVIRQSKPYFELNLELAVKAGGRTVQQTIAVGGQQTAFSIPVPGRPRQLTVDPHINIFRKLAPGQVPPTVNTIKGSQSPVVVVARGQGPGAMEAADRLTRSMGLHPAAVGLEDRFSGDDLAGKDMILVGLPGKRIWRPGPSDDFKIAEQGFVLNGRMFNGPGISFFGVFRRSAGDGNTVALFLPADLSMARTVSGKITHYGRYSYLVFKDNQNQVKGTWEPDQSPLTMRWTN